MESAVTQRGQTVIPAPLRKRYKIRSGDKLMWIDDGESIRVVPVPSDPVSALEGSARGEKLLEKLLGERQREREREQ